MKTQKTNAVRILAKQKKPFQLYTYSVEDGQKDGLSVAAKIAKPPHVVFKTLVTVAKSGAIFVAVIPVGAELDFKKLQHLTGEKKVDMLPAKEIQHVTNYERGGCSPIGMKKQYATYIDHSAKTLEQIVISAGKIGLQLELQPTDLLALTNGHYASLTK